MTAAGSSPDRSARSPGDVERILRERAARFAAPLTPATPAATSQFVVFKIADEQYGLDAMQVAGVIPLRGLTRVPCTPPVIAGVVNHHGRIVLVLDLRPLFGLPAIEPTPSSRVVLVDVTETSSGNFGLLADEIGGTITVATDVLAAAPATTHAAGSFLRAVTPSMVTVLDAEALARDPRLIVNDEAE